MLTLQITPPNSLSSQTPAGTPEFVELDPKYVCILCNNVLHDAVQTPCGHRLCQLCADGFLKDSESKQCPYQEEMCEILRPEQVLLIHYLYIGVNRHYDQFESIVLSNRVIFILNRRDL